MALGDIWVDCSDARRNLGLGQILKLMIYDDGAGNPVWTTNTNTSLSLWFDCSTERHNVSLEQVLKLMIVEDANGDPQWNISNL